MDKKYKSTEDWELEVGKQVRQRRLAINLSVIELAKRANLGEKSLRNLEGGKGSSLSTLIKVVSALGNEDWLQQLSPEPTISPIAMLTHKSGDRKRKRASKKCKPITQ